MKQYIIIFISIFCINMVGLKAQIGVYTDNPKYLFHLDAKGNNPSSGTVSAAMLSDDFVVDSNGDVGVGVTPTTKLDINGDLFYSGTGLKQDMRLVSDAQGYASWKEINDMLNPIESILKGLLYGNADGLADPNQEDASRSITVPKTWTNLTRTTIKVTPGIWLIYSSVGASGVANKTGPNFFWIQLRNKTNGQVLETVGGLHEYEGGYWAKPQFVKLITFAANSELEVWGISDVSVVINNRYGGTHFGAVKILSN